ncbi:MAG TPA: hypothetical protein PK500_02605, partial [Candidatus Egerieousia sp.]|nr:hypothetical protein [Candidatus Egerieousia sp.]
KQTKDRLMIYSVLKFEIGSTVKIKDDQNSLYSKLKELISILESIQDREREKQKIVTSNTISIIALIISILTLIYNFVN